MLTIDTPQNRMISETYMNISEFSHTGYEIYCRESVKIGANFNYILNLPKFRSSQYITTSMIFGSLRGISPKFSLVHHRHVLCIGRFDTISDLRYLNFTILAYLNIIQTA